MHIEGEGVTDNDRIHDLCSELHGQQIDGVLAAKLSGDELGVHHLLGQPDLEQMFGWDRSTARDAGLLDLLPGTPGGGQPAAAGGAETCDQ